MVERNTRGLDSQRFNIVQCNPIYVSPGMFDSLLARSNQVESGYSSDLFAIGLCILEAGLFAPVGDRLCDYRRKKFQTDTLDLYLSEFEHYYEGYDALVEVVRELVALKGPARTDPNYLAKSQIEERLVVGISPKRLEYSWVGRISEASIQTQDGPHLNWLLREKIPHTIFNSNHNLDSDTPRDSFLEDSLIVAHHISPVSQNLQPKLREGFPKNHANIQGNDPYHGNVLKFVSDFPQNPEPSKPHLSSLLQEASGQSHIQQSNQIPPSPNRPERITFNPHPAASPVSTTKIFQQQPYQISSPIRNQVPTSQPLDPEPVRSDLKRIISSNQRQTEQSPVTPRKLRKRFIQKVDTQVSQMIVVTEKENICLNNSFKANDCYSASKPKPNNPLEFRFTDQNSPMHSPLKGHREYSVNYMTPTKSPKNEAVASHKSFNPFNLY